MEDKINMIAKLPSQEFEDIICKSKRSEGIPNDFYYENKNHFYFSCRKIVSNKTKINIKALEPTLRDFCDLLYSFTLNNLERINDKTLRYPTGCYSLFLSYSYDDESLLKSLKCIKNIIDDYKEMFTMPIEEILDDNHLYIYVDKRKNLGAKAKELVVSINATWSDKGIENKLIEKHLVNLFDKSGIYKLYDEDRHLSYIGKSYNLAERIVTSIRERKASYFSYCVLNNKVDTDIYEIYYIAKLKPPLNTSNKNEDLPSIELKDLDFIDPIYIFQENSEIESKDYIATNIIEIKKTISIKEYSLDYCKSNSTIIETININNELKIYAAYTNKGLYFIYNQIQSIFNSIDDNIFDLIEEEVIDKKNIAILDDNEFINNNFISEKKVEMIDSIENNKYVILINGEALLSYIRYKVKNDKLKSWQTDKRADLIAWLINFSTTNNIN